MRPFGAHGIEVRLIPVSVTMRDFAKPGPERALTGAVLGCSSISPICAEAPEARGALDPTCFEGAPRAYS